MAGFDLSTIKFNVETDQLKEAVTEVGKLATAVGQMNDAIKKSTAAKRDSAKATKEQVQDAKAQAALAKSKADQDAAEAKSLRAKVSAQKAQEAASKAASKAQTDLGTSAQEAGEKLSAADRIVVKETLSMKALRGEALTAADGVVELGKGFTRTQASLQASLLLLGGTTNQLQELAASQRQLNAATGGNKLDQSLVGITKMDKEIKELAMTQEFSRQGIALTRKEISEYVRASEILVQQHQSEGKSTKWLSDQQDNLRSKYIERGNTLNKLRAEATEMEKEARKIANSEIAAAKDTASAKAFVTRETERLNAALTNTAQGATVTVSNQLVKMEAALKRAGYSATETASKLETYRQGLLRLQKTSNDRQIDNISRALGPQITDISVGLATGQSPLTILLQQGGQLRDQMALAGVAADQMGAAIRRAGSEMASSVWATGKGVITGIGGAMLDLGKSAGQGVANSLQSLSLLIGKVVLSKQEQLEFNKAIAEGTNGVGKFANMLTSGFAGGVFASTIGLLIGSLITLGVQLYKIMSLSDDLTVALANNGARFGLNTQQALAYAESLNAVGISTTAGLEVMQEMVKAGNLGEQSFRQIAIAAVDMEKYAGVAIEDTVKQFSKIADDPVKALYEYAKATGFVTTEVLDMVQTLQRQGRQADATKLAMDALANGQSRSIDIMKSDLSGLSSVWMNLKSDISKATTALVEFFSVKKPPDPQMESYQKALAAQRTQNQQLARNKEVSDALSEQLISDFDNINKAALSKAQYVENYIKRIWVDSAKKAGVNKEDFKLTKDQVTVAESIALKEYENIHKASTNKAQAAARKEQNAQEAYWVRILEQAKTAVNKYTGAVDDLTQSEIALKNVQDDNRWSKIAPSEQAIIKSKFEQAIAAEKLNRELEATNKFTQEYSVILREQQEQLDREAENLELRASLIGKTIQEQKKLRQEYERSKKMDIASDQYAAELAKIEAKKYVNPDEEYKARMELLKKYEARVNQINQETAIEAAENFEEEFKGIHDAVADTIADALFNGGKKGSKSLREAILAKLREPITIQINAIANVITQGIGQVLGSSGGLIGNLVGAGQSAGTLSNVLSLGGNVMQIMQGGAGLSLSAGIGQTISNLGSVFGSTGMQSFGIGMSLPGSSVASAAGGALGAGSSVGSVMSSIGSALPWIGAALAVVNLIKGLDDSGTIHTGGISQYSLAGGTKTAPNVGAYGGEGFNTGFGGVNYSADAIKLTTGVAKGMVGLFDSTAKKFGKAVGYEVATGFADDTSKDGAWAALRISLGGNKVLNWNDTRGSRWSPREMSNGEQGMRDYFRLLSEAIAETTKEISPSAILDTSITELVKAFKSGTTDSNNFNEYLILLRALVEEGANIEGLNNQISSFMDGTSKYIQEGEKGSAALIRLLGGLKMTNQMLDQLGKTMFESSMIGADFSNSLSELFGGFQNLQSSLNTYYQSYYSEAERTQKFTESLTTAFQELGFTLPSNIQEMKNLVNAQDLTTEAGRETFAKLIGLSGGITTLYGTLDNATSKMKEFTNSILEYVANLNRTEGSLSTSSSYAESEFAKQLGLARSGNTWSMDNITSYADQVINRAKETSKSSYEYDRVIRSVQAELLGLTNGTTPGTILTSSGVTNSTVQPIETVADNTQTTQEILQQILSKLSEMQAEDRAEGVPTVTHLSDIAKVIKRVDNGDSLRITDVTPA